MIEGTFLLLILVIFLHLFFSVEKSIRGGRGNLVGLFEFLEARRIMPEKTEKKARKYHA